MDAIRYDFDEPIAGAVAEALRRRGIEVLTLTEAEMPGTTDEAHLAFAREEGRTIVTQDIVTQDDDFLRLAAQADNQADDHAGVVYLPQRWSIGETVRGLALIAGVLGAEGIRRHVEFLRGV
jgi:DNA-binding response OmpR family regulator